ncbi:MAG: hypothetical protein MJ227_02775 [Bacilli bacterium]|nr:hypothetical protein [Bacilli bacterium]
MNKILLTEEELQNHYVGAAITLTTVMAVIASALMAVVIYKLFISNKGTTTVPGGWKFTWN